MVSSKLDSTGKTASLAKLKAVSTINGGSLDSTGSSRTSKYHDSTGETASLAFELGPAKVNDGPEKSESQKEAHVSTVYTYSVSPAGNSRAIRENKRAPGSSTFTWMTKSPAKSPSVKKKLAGNRKEEMITNNSKRLDLSQKKEQVLKSVTKKRYQPLKAVTGVRSEKSQPKIDNVYKRVPLKRPCFEFDGQQSKGGRPSEPVPDQVADAAAIFE